MVSSGQFNVTNDVVGKQLEEDKLKKDIKSKINGVLSEDVISIVAPVREVKPKISATALKTINTRISSYTTNFASSAEGRATNIGLSTKSINGHYLCQEMSLALMGL